MRGGATIVKELTLTTSYMDYTIDYSGDVDFSSYVGKNKVNLWGITMEDASSVVSVAKLEFGAIVVSTPTVQASNIIFSNVTQSQFNINWTRGNGDKCAVFVKDGNSGTAAPVDLTSYTANANFGSGTQIGTTGWFCVYNGTGTSTTVKNLQINREYQIMVIEYNGPSSKEKYLTNSAADNPIRLQTIPGGNITVLSQIGCIGGSVTFQLENYTVGTNPVSVQWYGPSGAISTATPDKLTLTGVTAAVAGNYYANISNSFGSYNTPSSTLVINAIPTVSAGPDVTICNGEKMLLTAAGASSYLWTPGNINSANASVAPATTTTYTVTGTTNGCSATDQVTVTVNNLPNVVAGGGGTICAGNSKTLTASGATTFTWTPGSSNGASISVTPASTTTYSVTGTENECSATSTVTVIVNQLPSVSAGADVTICSGETATLTASGAISYLWNPGGSTSGIAFVSPTTTTTYTVGGTDGNGCSAVDHVVVTVNTCTDIENSIIAKGIALYPNPNAGNFIIKTTNKEGRIILMNANGAIVKTITTSMGNDTYQVNELNKGIYFVNFISNEGSSKIEKFIVE